MYNTKYKCVKSLKVYERDSDNLIGHTVPRGSIWQLAWCGGKYSFKELVSKLPWNNKRTEEVTLSLPDELVERHFKKV